MSRNHIDLPLVDALSALRKAQEWLNEKHDAPVRAKLHHASVKVQEAMQYIRAARTGLTPGALSNAPEIPPPPNEKG